MTVTTPVLPSGDLDTAIAEGARAYELDRKHVFHSWSAQAQIKPMTIVASEGSYVWDGEGQQAPRLLGPAGVHQYRASASEGRCGHCRAGGQAVHDRAAARQRRPFRGRPPHRRAHSG